MFEYDILLTLGYIYAAIEVLSIAAALFYRQLGISLRAVTVIALLLLTAPVAAHLIARASYRSGVALSERTWIDELSKNE